MDRRLRGDDCGSGLVMPGKTVVFVSILLHAVAAEGSRSLAI